MPDQIEKISEKCSVILMPIGPNSSPHNITDTIESIYSFSTKDTVLVLVDETRSGLKKAQLSNQMAITICRAEPATGYSVRGRLYTNLSKAIKTVVKNYKFDVLLRMDDDALMIGEGAQNDAAKAFSLDPSIGALGSFRHTCLGHPRDFRPAARRLAFESSWLGMVKSPRLARRLRQIREIALTNGYEPGEHSLGAACFYSHTALVAMLDGGLLGCEDLATTSLCDDQLFGLLVVAAGFRSADFAGDGEPLGLTWRGLPASPSKLVQMNKKIVHSVKSHNGRDEANLRADFARLRQAKMLITAAHITTARQSEP
ncbi:hypothetical protein GAO09_08705 [Rhizobiales bacterium RZME27]|uniref:Glycosyltransferase family 2 protein n=1 Tax=Endobacterium cereale TaxID=2663029 RepID=A0A6A8A513_9HYPH|nr:hypothetical protein [Endobacterium cereale]MEB2848144.1 hypothetical protein [Endobacterium cereale]MQY46133.1 hypothetical protein [Endobacterium cereale]